MKRKNKNILVGLISFLASIFFFYFLFCINTYTNKYDEISYLFKSLENIEFHKKYSKSLHHVRGAGTLNDNSKPENFLFTTIREFSKNSDNVLMQGDSWIRRSERYKLPYNLLDKFATQNNIGLIMAGIESYSPTLMKLQYEILEKDFNFFPNIVVAYIDQTDIGDELCRYKNKRVFDKNNKLIGVTPETQEGAFKYFKLYKISEITILNESKFIRSIKITNYLIYNGFEEFFKKIKTLFTYEPKQKKIYPCGFGAVQKYLFKSSVDDILYFSNRINDYINFLVNKDYIKKVIVVTFPHKKNLGKFLKDDEKTKKYYSINVSDIVDDVVRNKNKVQHLNFSKLILSRKIKVNKEIYQKNDPGSHLYIKYHSRIFVQKIVDLLLNK